MNDFFWYVLILSLIFLISTFSFFEYKEIKKMSNIPTMQWWFYNLPENITIKSLSSKLDVENLKENWIMYVNDPQKIYDNRDVYSLNIMEISDISKHSFSYKN
jgi:hypothetical protein